jgi:hypothetical protein
METPKFIKKIAKGATMVSIGVLSFLPNESRGQDININNNHKTESIKISQLDSNIFNLAEKGVKNGTLKNSLEYPFFYSKEAEGYNISCDFDINYDKNQDESPRTRINYKDGSLNFFIEKDPKKGNRDIAFSGDSNVLPNSSVEEYGDFSLKNRIIIGGLNKKHPIYFRQINNSEKGKILLDLERILGGPDSVTSKQNLDNINKLKKEQEFEKQKKEFEDRIIDSVKSLFLMLKQNNIFSSSDGFYKYELYDGFKIFCKDKEGNQNEISFYTNPNFHLRKAQKIILKNFEHVSIQDLSSQETEDIIKDALLKTNK